jgi:hypothetical protein
MGARGSSNRLRALQSHVLSHQAQAPLSQVRHYYLLRMLDPLCGDEEDLRCVLDFVQCCAKEYEFLFVCLFFFFGKWYRICSLLVESWIERAKENSLRGMQLQSPRRRMAGMQVLVAQRPLQAAPSWEHVVGRKSCVLEESLFKKEYIRSVRRVHFEVLLILYVCRFRFLVLVLVLLLVSVLELELVLVGIDFGNDFFFVGFGFGFNFGFSFMVLE